MRTGSVVFLLTCLALSLCFGQSSSSSSSSPVSSSKYEPAQVMAAKVHQPLTDEDSRIVRYDVTVHVADMEYVVLYTPPEGIDVVEYQLGRSGLALVGTDTIKWNDMLGRPHEAPILSRRAIPARTGRAASAALGEPKGQKAKARRVDESPEQQLTHLEQAWTDAYMHADIGAIERIEAPGFIFTDSEGKITGRTEDIADLKAGAYKVEIPTVFEDLKVHLFGDTAVVTTREVLKQSYKGKDISGTWVYTEVFVKRGDRWQAVASQGTKIR